MTVPKKKSRRVVGSSSLKNQDYFTETRTVLTVPLIVTFNM
jgi:hypothetical protein